MQASTVQWGAVCRCRQYSGVWFADLDSAVGCGLQVSTVQWGAVCRCRQYSGVRFAGVDSTMDCHQSQLPAARQSSMAGPSDSATKNSTFCHLESLYLQMAECRVLVSEVSDQDGDVNIRPNHRLHCVTSKRKGMTRTRSQGLNNSNVMVPSTK